MATIAINGLGRIGRAAFKIILETPELELRAVNDLNAADDLAYLLNYDTVYGRYHKKISPVSDGLRVEEKTYPVFSEKDPARLPWRKLEIDIVLECTGMFNQLRGLATSPGGRRQDGHPLGARQKPGDRDCGPPGEHGGRANDRHHFLRQLHHELHYPRG